MPVSLDLVMEATDRLRSNRDNAADSVEQFPRERPRVGDDMRRPNSGWKQWAVAAVWES
jgi:hypothetical protein